MLSSQSRTADCAHETMRKNPPILASISEGNKSMFKRIAWSFRRAVMKVRRSKYSLLGRALDYVSLFLVGLISWTCDRFAANTSISRGVPHPPSHTAREH